MNQDMLMQRDLEQGARESNEILMEEAVMEVRTTERMNDNPSSGSAMGPEEGTMVEMSGSEMRALLPEADALLNNLEELGFHGCRIVECSPDLTSMSLGVVTRTFDELKPLAAIADALIDVEPGSTNELDFEVQIQFAAFVEDSEILWTIDVGGSSPEFLGAFHNLVCVFLDAASAVYLPCDKCGKPVKVTSGRPLDMWAGELAVKRYVYRQLNGGGDLFDNDKHCAEVATAA